MTEVSWAGPERRYEQEAERLRFKALLLDREIGINAAKNLRRSTFRRQPSEIKSIEKGMGDSGRRPPDRRQTFAAQAPGKPTALTPDAPSIRTTRDELSLDFAAAHYLLDFGYIVKGSTRSKKVKFTNTGTEPVLFNFDVKALELQGVAAVPAVPSVRLMPAPDKSSTHEYTFTLNTNRVGAPLGPSEVTLPIYVKNGPPALLTVRSNAIYPDMSLSADTLDFGTVLAGNCKIHTVQLVNEKPALVEWTASGSDGDKSKKRRDYVPPFRCEPSEGILEPGQRLNMKVIFQPLLKQEGPYNEVISISIKHSKIQRTLTCSGEGKSARLEFSPGSLDCGAILPWFEDQKANEALVCLHNPCDFPVEVVCMDCDQQYVENELALQMFEGCVACALS